ncbi:MAG: hypothetical protein GY834_03095 [Bacteroidetes bacterium]|nr:hypothetical protein [Bacteroidota bacterium]
MIDNLFNELTESIIGLPVNYVWRGDGAAIFVEFGNLSKEENRNHPQGEYSLMLDCDWRIEKPRSILVGSGFSQRRIDSQIKNLISCKVTKIELTGYVPELIVSLSPKFRIVSFSSYESQPAWGLFLPDKSWLCCKHGKILNDGCN